jgi:type I restriction enzyme S subunit
MRNEWLPTPLKAITLKIGSGSTPKGGKEVYQETGMALIRSMNVLDGVFEPDGLARISDTHAKKLSGVSVAKNDVLVNITGASVARCCLVPDDILPARVNQHVAIIRLDPKKADARFIAYSLTSNYHKTRLLNIASTGGTREALTKEDLELFELPLPSLPEQQRIGVLLSAYDDLIATNVQRQQLLEVLARQLYQEWFVRHRFPGHLHTPIVNGLPMSWELKKLGKVLELAYGKALKDEERVPGPFPVYGSSGIVGSHKKALVEGPGIIVGRKGNVGSVFWSFQGFFPIDTVYFVRSSISLYYLFFNLKQQNFINGDSAVPGLSRSQAYANDVVVPPPHLLEEFDRIVTPIFVQLRTLSDTNSQLRRTRDALLPRLLSGQLDVRTAELVLAE